MSVTTSKKQWTKGDTVDITHPLYDEQGATITTTSGTVTIFYRFNEGPWQSDSGSVSGTTGVTYTFSTGLPNSGLMEWYFKWSGGGSTYYTQETFTTQVKPAAG